MPPGGVYCMSGIKQKPTHAQVGQALANLARAKRFTKKLARKIKAQQNKTKGY